eukprot:455231-Rhodomonas_salina.1
MGFPVDLTELMAEEKGLRVDVKGFEQCMAQQKQVQHTPTPTSIAPSPTPILYPPITHLPTSYAGRCTPLGTYCMVLRDSG